MELLALQPVQACRWQNEAINFHHARPCVLVFVYLRLVWLAGTSKIGHKFVAPIESLVSPGACVVLNPFF